LSTDVPDGATQRHSRMMELLTFINLAEPQGATITQIQSYMLTVFGSALKLFHMCMCACVFMHIFSFSFSLSLFFSKMKEKASNGKVHRKHAILWSIYGVYQF